MDFVCLVFVRNERGFFSKQHTESVGPEHEGFGFGLVMVVVGRCYVFLVVLVGSSGGFVLLVGV